MDVHAGAQFHGDDAAQAAVAAFARRANGGLVVTANSLGSNHPGVIPALAARYKLPAVYPVRNYGGLISYGPDFAEQYPRAAGYIDRILKGQKPGDLPIQMPIQVPLIINLRTANALGLDVPLGLLNAADEIIE